APEGRQSIARGASPWSGIAGGAPRVSRPGEAADGQGNCVRHESLRVDGTIPRTIVTTGRSQGLTPLATHCRPLRGLKTGPFASRAASQGLAPLATHCRPLRGLKINSDIHIVNQLHEQ